MRLIKEDGVETRRGEERFGAFDLPGLDFCARANATR
jgi:hypothetical protein